MAINIALYSRTPAAVRRPPPSNARVSDCRPKADSTITPDSGQSKSTGAADPTLTFTNTPALLGTDTFSGALSRAVGENVGPYAISLGTLSAGANYALSLSTAGRRFHDQQAPGDVDHEPGEQDLRRP